MSFSAEYRRILSRMGYYDYQSRLIFRHLGQEDGWDGHLTKCRNFILGAVETVKPEIVTVLGSGWLLDVPLAEMLVSVKKINLVDVVHPPDVLQQAATFGKVNIINDDVSGGLIAEVWERMQGYSFLKKKKTLSDIAVKVWEPGFETGMVISLNILTQLEALPIAWIRKKASVSDTEYDQLRLEVQKSHLRFLSERRSVLISDTEEVFSGPGAEHEAVRTALAAFPHGEKEDEWQWDFDLKGADAYTRRSIMKVKAVLF